MKIRKSVFELSRGLRRLGIDKEERRDYIKRAYCFFGEFFHHAEEFQFIINRYIPYLRDEHLSEKNMQRLKYDLGFAVNGGPDIRKGIYYTEPTLLKED
jgi:hypothetical protein